MPVMFLFDVDQTLRGPRGENNAPRIISLIKTLQDQGHFIGLHSDTSTDRLKRIAADFGIYSGPIIGERSQVVINGIPDQLTIFNYRLIEGVSYLKKALPVLINSHFENKATVHHFFNQPEELSHAESLIETGKITIACYYLRHVSLSFFIFNPEFANNPTEDPLSDHFKYLVERFVNESNLADLKIEISPGDHYIQLMHQDTQKRDIIPWIRNHYKVDRILMFGDSMTDFCSDSSVIQCAVGNAHPEYKAHCQIVANATYTAGVYECLHEALTMISH